VQPLFRVRHQASNEAETPASRKPWRIQRAEEEEALANPACMCCVADNKCRFGICWLRLSISERVEQEVLSVNGVTRPRH
jgi:hypothetical protein